MHGEVFGAGHPLPRRVGGQDRAPRLVGVVLDDGCPACEQPLQIEWVNDPHTERRLPLGVDVQVEDEHCPVDPARVVHGTRRAHQRRRTDTGSARPEWQRAIYGWRGAHDVMTGFTGNPLILTRSFRFGAPQLVAEAHRWLTLADAPSGSPEASTPPPLSARGASQPSAVLCRTNVGAVTEILTFQQTGTPTALAGGGDALRALAQAARDLIQGRRTHHPGLLLFTTWNELFDCGEPDPAGDRPPAVCRPRRRTRP